MGLLLCMGTGVLSFERPSFDTGGLAEDLELFKEYRLLWLVWWWLALDWGLWGGSIASDPSAASRSNAALNIIWELIMVKYFW